MAKATTRSKATVSKKKASKRITKNTKPLVEPIVGPTGTKKAEKAKPARRPGRRTKYTVGIDLGGTKVSAALVSQDGEIIQEIRKPTVPQWMRDHDIREKCAPPTPAQVKKHIQYVVEAMAEAALEAMDGKEIVGVGLASAGPMNVEKGVLENPANFKGWKIVPLVDLLRAEMAEQGYKTQVHFQNDAIAAALGEGWIGRAAGCHCYAMITVGTGIGSGVIFNNRPAQFAGMGSEWGHMLAQAGGLLNDRGNYYERSVEGLASGTGIIRRAKARGFKGESASDVAEAADEGDKLAIEIFDGAAEGLAALLCTLSLGFHPQRFVFSGGMLAVKEHFLPKTIDIYRDLMKREYPAFLAPVHVAKLGTEAGVIGAARLPYLAD